MLYVSSWLYAGSIECTNLIDGFLTDLMFMSMSLKDFVCVLSTISNDNISLVLRTTMPSWNRLCLPRRCTVFLELDLRIKPGISHVT